MEIPVHPETNSVSFLCYMKSILYMLTSISRQTKLTVARDTAIRPVTIRQVLSAKIQSPDADFKIDGNLVRTVSVHS